MTLGVRGVVHDRSTRSVLLVRHTYVPGWQLPGGGVESGESVWAALERELSEEANVEISAPPRLVSVHHNHRASRRDHVVVFLVEDFVQTAAKAPDSEIAEAGFFGLDDLPKETTPATRRRLAELFDAEPAGTGW